MSATSGPRPAVVVLVTVAVLFGLTGCGSSRLTATRLASSIGPTFARLYVQQQVASGNPRPVLADLHPRAFCRKGAPDDVQHGPGNDWLCYVSYVADGPGTRVVASYTVTLQTNGCYAADGDGPTTLNGRQTITGPGYRQVRNPLFLVDGCFDVG